MPTIQTNDIQTYYEQRGDGPPIVFVHGAIVDYAQWEPQLAALSDEYTTVAYDVRGHGRTGGSPVEQYSIDLFVEDLDALITALNLDQPVLCGLSLGGAIAQAYATTYPEKIAGLVLADTFTPSAWAWPERLQWVMLRATILPTRLIGYERVENAMVWIQERIQGKGVSGDREKIAQLRATGPKMTTDEFAKVIRALGRFPRMHIDLSTIMVPTLVLYGEHDAGFIARHSARMAAEIPDAELQIVPNGGHAANLDEPEFVTAALRDFLDERVYSDVVGDGGDAEASVEKTA